MTQNTIICCCFFVLDICIFKFFISNFIKFCFALCLNDSWKMTYSNISKCKRSSPWRRQKSRLFEANRRSVTRKIWKFKFVLILHLTNVSDFKFWGLPVRWRRPMLHRNKSWHWLSYNKSIDTKRLALKPMWSTWNKTPQNSWPSLKISKFVLFIIRFRLFDWLTYCWSFPQWE